MSDTIQQTPLRERLAGKWQIPAFILSVALLLGSLVHVRPPSVEIPLDQTLSEMEELLGGGLYASTIDLGRWALEREKKRSARELGPVHLFLGRAMFLQSQAEKRHTSVAARQVIQDLEAASLAGVPLIGEDHQYLGTAYEWLGEPKAAVEHYETAIAASDAPPLSARQRVIQLRSGLVETPPEELHALLDAFIADAHSDPPRLHWAVERKLNLLMNEDKDEEAIALVESLRPVFEPSELREAFEYLRCLIDYRAGRFDEAEAGLRALRNRLVVRDETYVLSGWLLGRVVLNDGSAQRPEEALSFFRDVISAKVSARYTAASQTGAAEALAELGRHEEAVEHFRQAVELLPQTEADSLFSRDTLRSSITAVGSRLRDEGRPALALQFFDMADGLTDPANTEQMSFYLDLLGKTREAVAQSLQAEARGLKDSEGDKVKREAIQDEARRLFLSAGEAFVRLAKINTLNDRLASSAAWRAADLFDEAGARERTIELLRTFVTDRPDDSLSPRAWVRLGQSLQSMGRFAGAIEAYQECNRRFRRTLEANQSLIPLADCYMRLGPDYTDQAVKTLHMVLNDSQLFTPEAPEFCDAMFMLGDLLNREVRFEEAISTLEEALRRYADDERALRGLYLLADSYRLSAMALKEDAKDPRFVGERENMRKEERRRLVRAADLYAQLIARYEEQDENTLSEKHAMYLRHARLFQGDCLFELQRYAEALKIFERTAWIYKDVPSALAAYVQIVNCHVFLGQYEEGEAALRRANYLVKTIPDVAFQNSVVPESREEWKEYFDWIERSKLLKPSKRSG